jgi:hypothetical protein
MYMIAKMKDKPIIVKSECMEAVAMINDKSMDRSKVAALIDIAKHLCR